MDGEKLGNEPLKERLTSDGSSINDWGKYETKTYPSPSGEFKAHFYKNERTGAIHYDDDYKSKFNRPLK